MGRGVRAAAALAILAIALSGCGDSTEEQGQTTTTSVAAKHGGGDRAKGQRSTSPSSDADQRQIETLEERFPAPKAKTKQVQEAIDAGRDACRGKTPIEVKEEFYSQAQAELDPAQQKMIAQIAAYEAKANRDLSFAAGQLGAVVYERTLAEAERSYGFQGCVYELARGLEAELGGG